MVLAFSFKLAVSLFLCPCLCVVCATCFMEQLLPFFRPMRRTQYQNWISLFSSPVLTVNLESGIGCVPSQPTKCYDPCGFSNVYMTGMQRKLWCKHVITKFPATKKARYKRSPTWRAHLPVVAMQASVVVFCLQLYSSQVLLRLPAWLLGWLLS